MTILVRGNPVFTSDGKFGKALSGGVLGAPEGIIPVAAPGAAAAETWTMEGWVNVAAAASANRVAFGYAGYAWVGMNPSGKGFAVFGIQNQASITSDITIADGLWHHLAIVSTAGVPSFYVDGVKAASSATGFTRDPNGAGTTRVGIGGMGGSSLAAFDWPGLVDEFALSTAAQYSGASFTPPSTVFAANRPGQTYLLHLDSNPVGAAIAPNNAGIVYSPFNWDVTAARALCNTGGYFKTQVNGATAIALKFDVANVPATAAQRTQIEYRVDGGAWVALVPTSVVDIPIPAETASWAKHLVEVRMKSSTEAQNRWEAPYLTAVKFTGIEATPSTATLTAPRGATLAGLFLGDSITEGINTLSNTGDAAERSNSRLSWATAVGDELGSEIGVVGFGRQGLVVAGNGSVPVLGSTWKLIASGINRSFSVQPDYVCINIGTNDQRNSVTAAQFTAAYTALLNDILATLPDAVVVVLHTFGQNYTAAAYTDAIAACTDPRRVAYVPTVGWWAPADASDGLHPYGYANLSQIAPRAAAAIRENLSSGGRQYINIDGSAVSVVPKRV